MSEPFLGEIRAVGFTFAPNGWALCNGQLLPINQNTALFSLLGTMYGGNGTTTFALPNLQGCAAMHVGNGHVQGETGGQETHTVVTTELPSHSHQANAQNANGDAPSPQARSWGLEPAAKSYTSSGSLTGMNPAGVAPAGGSQPHDNWSPFLVVNYVIALTGIFPSRN